MNLGASVGLGEDHEAKCCSIFVAWIMCECWHMSRLAPGRSKKYAAYRTWWLSKRLEHFRMFKTPFPRAFTLRRKCDDWFQVVICKCAAKQVFPAHEQGVFHFWDSVPRSCIFANCANCKQTDARAMVTLEFGILQTALFRYGYRCQHQCFTACTPSTC